MTDRSHNPDYYNPTPEEVAAAQELFRRINQFTRDHFMDGGILARLYSFLHQQQGKLRISTEYFSKCVRLNQAQEDFFTAGRLANQTLYEVLIHSPYYYTELADLVHSQNTVRLAAIDTPEGLRQLQFASFLMHVPYGVEWKGSADAFKALDDLYHKKPIPTHIYPVSRTEEEAARDIIPFTPAPHLAAEAKFFQQNPGVRHKWFDRFVADYFEPNRQKPLPGGFKRSPNNDLHPA